MGRRISDSAVRRMRKLSQRGMVDREIARRIGVGTNVVANALARIAPDGRIMPVCYGDKRNDPKYVRSGCSIGLVDALPIEEFLRVRRHA